MKNNNARINDLIQALEGDQLTLKAIDGKLCKFATARTKRQDAKKAFTEKGSVHLTFVHARWAGDYRISLVLNAENGIVVHQSTLTGEGSATVHRILIGQPSRTRIEAESEIIAGCRLLGASYKGGGKFVTPCGVSFQLPLDQPVTAQEVRDAVICQLSWEIKKKPQISLTRI